jgi:hypothetical protein
MSRSPPLRFLVLLLAGWTGLRAAWLSPGWWTPPAEAGAAPRTGGSAPDTGAVPEAASEAERPPQRIQAALSPAKRRARTPLPRTLRMRSAAAAVEERPAWQALAWQLSPQARSERGRALRAGAGAATPRQSAPSRWSFAAWSFLRRGDAPALAPGGTLGGSQAGALARFRLNGDPARPLDLAVRLSSPVRRPAGAEAAVGIDWQPSRRIPLRLLAERRQALGREGRSAFGLTLHGGVNDATLAGPLRVEAYAQAGIVGTRSRDLFGDGALRLSLPLGRIRLGAGAWAAAQPGLARLDLGPQASLRLPLAGRNVAVAADWRFRVAGDARPDSGPTLTVATDF